VALLVAIASCLTAAPARGEDWEDWDWTRPLWPLSGGAFDLRGCLGLTLGGSQARAQLDVSTLLPYVRIGLGDHVQIGSPFSLTATINQPSGAVPSISLTAGLGGLGFAFGAEMETRFLLTTGANLSATWFVEGWAVTVSADGSIQLWVSNSVQALDPVVGGSLLVSRRIGQRVTVGLSVGGARRIGHNRPGERRWVWSVGSGQLLSGASTALVRLHANRNWAFELRGGLGEDPRARLAGSVGIVADCSTVLW
jgi:hypothetical protein